MALVPENLVDCEGIIEEILPPGKGWRIRFQGSYWSATSCVSTSFSPGEKVKVVAREGVHLLIEPA